MGLSSMFAQAHRLQCPSLLLQVITAQYFVWFFAFLPLILPSINMTRREAVLCAGLWLFSQLHWLAWAYHLEFEGMNIFVPLWLASLLFFSANIVVLCQVISNYTRVNVRKPHGSEKLL